LNVKADCAVGSHSSLAGSGDPIIHPSLQHLQWDGTAKKNNVMEFSEVKPLAQLRLGCLSQL
jgi:hypothetical protein